MTVLDITPLNLVQCICLRPRMYTPTGTLAEVYNLLTDKKCPHPIGGIREDSSVTATVLWLQKNARNPDNIVDEMLESHGTDEETLKVIYDFAATLSRE